MGALEFLCDIRFHRSFTLPPNPVTARSKPFRFSYADYGDSDSDAVVLLCGALMGQRLSYSLLDQLAKRHNVRIIHPDRPGIGGADHVEQGERIGLWLEMVPQLLAHLDISHISLASHSGGDIYLFNTLLTYPHLLHPTHPYITFWAPWVHPSHSGVTSMKATELLPAPLIGRFASIARFVHHNVMPLAGLSTGFLQGLKGSFYHSTPTPAPVPLTPKPLSRVNSKSDGPPGVALDDPVVLDELRTHVMNFVFAESMDGISADAQLFMKKPHSTLWCSSSVFWSDMDHAVRLLRKIIHDSNDENRRWLVEAIHAESDNMVGEKGRLWFDACWTSPESAPSSSGLEREYDRLEYQSSIVPQSEHNFLMDPVYGASEAWLERVRNAFPLQEQDEGTFGSDQQRTKALEHNRKRTIFAMKAKRLVHNLRVRSTKSASSEMQRILNMLNLVDDSSLTTACREGKMGKSSQWIPPDSK